MIETEMVGWHHRLNGHEFEQASGVGDRQGSLVCCSPWGCQELDRDVSRDPLPRNQEAGVEVRGPS